MGAYPNPNPFADDAAVIIPLRQRRSEAAEAAAAVHPWISGGSVHRRRRSPFMRDLVGAATIVTIVLGLFAVLESPHWLVLPVLGVFLAAVAVLYAHDAASRRRS